MAVRAVADVNLAAIERNAARLRTLMSGSSRLCAVVKADGYGHGAVPSAQAALAGGAGSLAVATAGEAVDLREGGVGAHVLLLGALTVEELPVAVAAGVEIAVWDERFVELARSAAARAGVEIGIHVKLDTGLGRLGTRDLALASALVDRVHSAEGLRLAGVMTHFATADEDPEFVAHQLKRFAPLVEMVDRLPDRAEVTVHAANSAAILRFPESHFDMARAGIALYGGDPMNQDATVHGLEPALSLRSYVAAVKAAESGDSAGYGRRFIAERETLLATLPIGYGDGLPRALTNNCDVLIGGRRYPLSGTVSMDNITVDLGRDTDVRIGDVATLIGVDRAERQSAEDLAQRIGTISYEVFCGISRRVPRTYRHDQVPA